MRKNLLPPFIFIIVMSGLSTHSAKAHKEWVHQWIVQEAYRFLVYELRGREIEELRIMCGVGTENGDDFFGKGQAMFTKYFKQNRSPIAVGAWREDYEDPVWHYEKSSSTLGISEHWTASDSHFWHGDSQYGLDAGTVIDPQGIGAGKPADNAWTKARAYAFSESGGDNQLLSMTTSDLLVTIYSEDEDRRAILDPRFMRIQYPVGADGKRSLCNFITTAKVDLRSLVVGSGLIRLDDIYRFKDQIVDLKEDVVKRHGYYYMGAMLHLLMDIGLPTHAKVDPHPCSIAGNLFADPDFMELWLGGNYSNILFYVGGECDNEHTEFPAKYMHQWETRNKFGSLLWETFSMSDIEALKYIFYTANQIGDYFPSSDQAGDVLLTNGSNDYLDHLYQEMALEVPQNLGVGGPLLTNYQQTHNAYVYREEIRNYIISYAIRATATLMYRYALKIGLIDECFENRKLQNMAVWGTPAVETPVAFAAQTWVHAGRSVHAGVAEGPMECKSGSFVRFKAGEYIALRDGFHAHSGSRFSAFVDPATCGPALPPAYIAPEPVSTAQLCSVTSDSIWISVPTGATVAVSTFGTITISTGAQIEVASTAQFYIPDNCLVTPDLEGEVGVFSSETLAIAATNCTITTTIGTITVATGHTLTYSPTGTMYIVPTSAKASAMSNRPNWLQRRERHYDNALKPNYPNPFRDETSIRYSVQDPGPVRLAVYNNLGVLIAQLVDTPYHVRGEFTVRFSSVDLPAGAYVCRLTSGVESYYDTMLLVR